MFTKSRFLILVWLLFLIILLTGCGIHYKREGGVTTPIPYEKAFDCVIQVAKETGFTVSNVNKEIGEVVLVKGFSFGTKHLVVRIEKDEDRATGVELILSGHRAATSEKDSKEITDSYINALQRCWK